MATQVPIAIFQIAKTQVNREAVKRWLDHLGVESDVLAAAAEQDVTDPALLIALAGKRCYNAFEVNEALNPNVTRVRKDWAQYLDNILASAHGSVCEHAVFTYALEGVSRVLTAELNRHRAGWAISEASMRYIRFGESIKYWEPDSIAGEPAFADVKLERAMAWLEQDKPSGAEVAAAYDLEQKKHLTRFIFGRSFDRQRDDYALMEKIWSAELDPKSDFQGKKEITSMMRRIIGLGCATGGTWTGNVRALRHVLTLRCSPGAEEEICHVFSRVAKDIVEQEPMLFGGFHRDDNGFWRPKYVKV